MRVCITGGSGSLGRRLIARLAHDGADRIVTMTRDEQKRASLQHEFEWHPGLRVFSGDVRDPQRLVDIFSGVEVVVHAAARKVVSSCHDEPGEHLATNVLGTCNVINAAKAAGVRKLLFISSDKACAPINIYGATKMQAEHLMVSANARTWANGLRCSVIRYGNVLASNGSVVRMWREIAARGEPLPVSDRRCTRFWLTLDQAVEYVLKAVMDLRGGEILLPHLKAAPLTRLLEAIAPTAQTVETGIRPGGEKLHESLLNEDEVRRARRRNGWYIVPPPDTSELWDRLPWLGEPTPENFTYRSDTWPDQWKLEELREVLDERIS